MVGEAESWVHGSVLHCSLYFWICLTFFNSKKFFETGKMKAKQEHDENI